MAITRREFIARVAHTSGYGAAFMTAHSLGLLGMVETEQRNDFPLPPSTGRGTKVIILGAGIAGLVCAYEMRRAGFDCTVLEARERPGGRNWTLRAGSKLVFNDGTSQECTFDQGNYFNCGPARLPAIHKTMLGYCRELGVALEVEVNSSRNSLLQNDNVFGGKPIRQAQAINDIRGHVAELLGKCVQQGALDQAFTPDDHALVMDFLKLYGDLGPNYQYQGSVRSGDRQIARRRRSDRSCPRSAAFLRPAAFEILSDPCSSKSGPTCRPPCSSLSAAWIGFPMRSPSRWGRWSAITRRSARSERRLMESECCIARATPGAVRFDRGALLHLRPAAQHPQDRSQ